MYFGFVCGLFSFRFGLEVTGFGLGCGGFGVVGLVVWFLYILVLAWWVLAIRVGWLTWMLAFTGTCAVWFSVYIGVFSGTASLGVCDMAGGN